MSINQQEIVKAKKLLRSGSFAEAIQLLSRLLGKVPNDQSCLLMRGEAYLKSEQFENALTDYAKVVEVDNKNILALNNFSLALTRCNRPHEAKEIIQYVHELDPNNFAGFINLGNIHQSLGEHKESVNSAMRAVEIDPKSALAYLNLGTSLGALGHVELAKQAFLMSNFLDPNSVTTNINLAQIEEKEENFSNAKDIYEQILLQENITSLEIEVVKYFLSYTYLYLGILEKGWEYYEYGYGQLLPLSSLRSSRKFSQPKWNGEQLKGKTLLIWREQGLGDEIVFATCLFDVADMGLDVILECESRLVHAYKRTFPNWKVRNEILVNQNNSFYNDFDFQCSIGSLPKLFRRTINCFINEKNLFKPVEDLRKKYSELLEPYKSKLLVGISWRGGVLSTLRNDNYTSLLDWKEVLTLPNCQFVNLQYGECEDELSEAEVLFGIEIIRWKNLDLKNDLESVMALASNLDYVVSVGTAISTIAPAVGVRTILLTRRTWLMLGEENKFPWFKLITPLIANKNELVPAKLKLVPDLLK
jgi:Flp pilus assembly protein TadD